jgi:hypothetical protein
MYNIPSEKLILRSVRELKAWALPTLLSKFPTADEIKPLGAFKIVNDPLPEITASQVIEPGEVMHKDGVSRQAWAVRDKTRQETLDSLPYKTAAEAKLAMVHWIDNLTAQVMNQYPQAVQKRWDVEEAAARAVIADSATPAQTELVTREGATKGRTPKDHATRIIANADRFRAIADQINTLFLFVDGKIDRAAGPEEYEGILQAAIESAAPLAKAYGLDL